MNMQRGTDNRITFTVSLLDGPLWASSSLPAVYHLGGRFHVQSVPIFGN